MADEILLSREGGIATVTLNRPERRNACDLAMWRRLGAVMGDGSRTSRATLFVRSGDAFGARAVFDAAAPLLAPFREEPGFVF